MKILIVAATQFEIAPLLKLIGFASYKPEENISVCRYKGHEVAVLVTGVGMVATAYCMGKNSGEDYDIAINAGICGSFNKNLETGTVVNVVEDCFSELGAENGEDFLNLGELNLKGITTFKNSNFSFENKLLELLPKVNGITVNTVHGNESSINKAIDRFHPIVESMEGAAFMFACQNSGIDYIQLRAVSNYVERRNKETWNIPLAIKNLNEKIMDVLDTF